VPLGDVILARRFRRGNRFIPRGRQMCNNSTGLPTMKNRRHGPFCGLLFCLLVCFSGTLTLGEEKAGAEWRNVDLPFRVLNVSSSGSSLWACGTDEAIAVSRDGGTTWHSKHRTANGGLLFNIAFANEKFGYAAGTGGLLLTSEDGGDTWATHSAGSSAILQVAFADALHGLIRTSGSLQYTADGGANWSAVSLETNANLLKTFPFVFSLAILDSQHMAVMLKQGAAQYEPSTFLVSVDAGKTWKRADVPNSTLYSFIATREKYWAIGTEVIHKEQKGGGYAVPVSWYSSDGLEWARSTSDLTACKMEMCVACTDQGCLSSNRTITNVFAEKVSYRIFPPNPKLTAKWAATESSMCFVGAALQCSPVTVAPQPHAGEGPSPVTVSPGPLVSKSPTGNTSQGPKCIDCALDTMLVDQKVGGVFIIELTLEIAKNGTVAAVTSNGAPTPEIKSRIEQQAEHWLFEPYVKDGVPMRVRLKTQIQINVIRPR
jgi:hypothetical protein